MECKDSFGSGFSKKIENNFSRIVNEFTLEYLLAALSSKQV
jgi:hypothetical protein